MLYNEIRKLLKDDKITRKAKYFLKKKSRDINARINQLQFGRNCSTAKKLVCEVQQNCGFLNFFSY
jgi:hypothetical protein